MILKLAIDKDWTSIGIATIAINLAPDLQVAISKQRRTVSEKHVHEIIIVERKTRLERMRRQGRRQRREHRRCHYAIRCSCQIPGSAPP
ncbi:unnamed protein product [Prunus armeniaca]|uniref:Uncharacterized protein n=1 Tax=Prunus armeniaca TaxID=36596 RepID=A0A6J5WHX6_PRUAR|nr:unnamed protein product [Prunus armeniaca]